MSLDKKEMGLKIKEARKIKGDKIGKRYTGNMLATDLDISRSYLGDLESGRVYPNYTLLSKIAEKCEVPLSFFDEPVKVLSSINVNTVLNGPGKLKTNIENIELSKKAERDIKKSLDQTLDMIEKSQDGLMFDGEPFELDDLTRELLKESLENSMRMAKKIAKEKFTPKKYKK